MGSGPVQKRLPPARVAFRKVADPRQAAEAAEPNLAHLADQVPDDEVGLELRGDRNGP